MDIYNERPSELGRTDHEIWPPTVEKDPAAVTPEIIRPSTVTGNQSVDFVLGCVVPPMVCSFLGAMNTALSSSPAVVLTGALISIVAMVPLFIGLMPWQMDGFSTTYRSPSLATGAWLGMVLTVAWLISLKLL